MQRLSNSATTIKKAAAAIQKTRNGNKKQDKLIIMYSFLSLLFSHFAACSNINHNIDQSFEASPIVIESIHTSFAGRFSHICLSTSSRKNC